MAPRRELTVGVALLAVLLAAFFAFVGYHKAFSPLAELAQHRVWTLVLPEPAGRIVGWSELLCGLLLLGYGAAATRPWAAAAALALIANQFVAAAVHAFRGEADALPQNAILAGLLALVVLAARHDRQQPGELQ